MPYASEPNLDFIAKNVVPHYLYKGDWLSPLLLHSEEIGLCPDLYCGTCSARDFKNTLRMVWYSNLNLSSQKLLSLVEHSSQQIIDDEVDLLIDGLGRINLMQKSANKFKVFRNVFGVLDGRFIGDHFPNDFHNNRLRQLIYFVWKETLQTSRRIWGGDYELLNRRWLGTLVSEEFLKMQQHYAAKRARINKVKLEGTKKVQKVRRFSIEKAWKIKDKNLTKAKNIQSKIMQEFFVQLIHKNLDFNSISKKFSILSNVDEGVIRDLLYLYLKSHVKLMESYTKAFAVLVDFENKAIQRDVIQLVLQNITGAEAEQIDLMLSKIEN